jgi:hypothetical protein
MIQCLHAHGLSEITLDRERKRERERERERERANIDIDTNVFAVQDGCHRVLRCPKSN